MDDNKKMELPSVEMVEVPFADLQALIRLKNDLQSENQRYKTVVPVITNLVGFVKDTILGGQFPEGKDIGFSFFAKVGKNAMGMVSAMKKNPEKYDFLKKDFATLQEQLPYLLNDEQIKKLA